MKKSASKRNTGAGGAASVKVIIRLARKVQYGGNPRMFDIHCITNS